MGYVVERLDPLSEEALREFGNVLRMLRGQRGLSQRALAARSGLSQSTISKLETGIARGVRIRVLARMLAGLDRPLEHPLDRPWIVAGPPGWKLLTEAFSTRGRLAQRVTQERARAALQRERLMQPQTSPGDGVMAPRARPRA
ncbi:MAG TPA: helix-turn-helix transcriptional regulator [Candidatus Eisenbacteria bacterium]|nr:helix-turn-helix transcriptional regulator [Candidatus Eisenbacteria bacterium]